MADCGIENYEFAGREMTGAEWELAEFMHPWASYNRTVYVLEGNHVTLDAGTGCVHTAPATAWMTLKYIRNMKMKEN